jgi:hypothetical protein
MTLSSFPTDSFGPAWRQSLDEIGGQEHLGRRLLARIEEAMEYHHLKPQNEVAASLTAIIHNVVEFRQGLDATISGLRSLKIGTGRLDPGECEIGVLIPRAAVHESVKELGEELRHLDFVFGTFGELATGKREPAKVKAISSSDLTLLVFALPVVAECVARAMERIIGLYRNVLEIRKLKLELERYVLDAEKAGVVERSNFIMVDGIDKLTVEMMSKCHESITEGRRNEISNKVRISLTKLANRVDRGFNIEVRAELPEPPKSGAEQSVEELRTRSEVESIRSTANELQFMQTSGERTLSLPDGSDEQGTAGT